MILASLRYGRKGGGYDAAAFWEDRHRRFRSDFRAVADREEDEQQRYALQRDAFLAFLGRNQIEINGAVCTEFGCGNGFWGHVVLDAGAAEYTGLDISPSAVKHCLATLSAGVFRCVDLGAELPKDLAGLADLVFSIDVLQHVVERERLATFLRNMAAAVKPGGAVVLTSYVGYGDRFNNPPEQITVLGLRVPKLRWVHAWDQPTLSEYLAPCVLIGSAKFWDKTILAFRRPP